VVIPPPSEQRVCLLTCSDACVCANTAMLRMELRQKQSAVEGLCTLELLKYDIHRDKSAAHNDNDITQLERASSRRSETCIKIIHVLSFVHNYAFLYLLFRVSSRERYRSGEARYREASLSLFLICWRCSKQHLRISRFDSQADFHSCCTLLYSTIVAKEL
jgi:hypothetical protein